MTKRTHIIAGAATAVLVVLIGGGIAYTSGLMSFNGFIPTFGNDERMPPLDKEIVFSESFPEASREPYGARIEASRESLKSDPDQPSIWLGLAIEYRAIGDTESAKEIWEYMVVKYPTLFVPLRNLGEHYFHEEKDYDKAEEYYLRALTVDPYSAIAYQELHEVYRYGFKDKEKAVAILKQAVQRLPDGGGLDMTMTLAGYYRDEGMRSEARASYGDARALAVKLKNTALVRMIDDELSRLR